MSKKELSPEELIWLENWKQTCPFRPFKNDDPLTTLGKSGWKPACFTEEALEEMRKQNGQASVFWDWLGTSDASRFKVAHTETHCRTAANVFLMDKDNLMGTPVAANDWMRTKLAKLPIPEPVAAPVAAPEEHEERQDDPLNGKRTRGAAKLALAAKAAKQDLAVTGDTLNVLQAALAKNRNSLAESLSSSDDGGETMVLPGAAAAAEQPVTVEFAPGGGLEGPEVAAGPRKLDLSKHGAIVAILNKSPGDAGAKAGPPPKAAGNFLVNAAKGVANFLVGAQGMGALDNQVSSADEAGPGPVLPAAPAAAVLPAVPAAAAGPPLPPPPPLVPVETPAEAIARLQRINGALALEVANANAQLATAVEPLRAQIRLLTTQVDDRDTIIGQWDARCTGLQGQLDQALQQVSDLSRQALQAPLVPPAFNPNAIEDLNGQIRGLRDEVKEANNILALEQTAHQATRDTFQLEYGRLNQETQQLRTQLADENVVRAKRAVQVAEDIADNRAGLTEDLRKAHQEIADLKARLSAPLVNPFDLATTRVEVKRLQDELAQAQQDLLAARGVGMMVDPRIPQLQAEVARLNALVAQSRTIATDLQDRLNRSEANVTFVQTGLDQANERLRNQQVKHHQADTEVTRLGGLLTAADAEVTRLGGLLTASNAEVLRLRVAVGQPSQEAAGLKVALDQANAQLAKVQQDFAQANATGVRGAAALKKAMDETFRVQGLLAQPNAEAIRLQGLLDAANATIARLQASAGPPADQARQSQALLDAANANVARLQGELNASNTHAAGLQRSLDESKAEVARLRLELDNVPDAFQRTATIPFVPPEVTRLQAELAQAEEKLVKLRKELETTCIRSARWEAVHTAQSTQMEKLETEIAGLKKAALRSVSFAPSSVHTAPSRADSGAAVSRTFSTASTVVPMSDSVLAGRYARLEKRYEELEVRYNDILKKHGLYQGEVSAKRMAIADAILDAKTRARHTKPY